MNGGSDSYKQYHFLKECIKNFQMFIRKLLEQIQISCSGQHKIAKKCTFLDNLRIINQERSVEARQMTPFFWSTFRSLTVTFILYLKMVKIHFRTGHHTFPEIRHPKVTTNPCYVLSSEGSQKKVSAHGLWEFHS